MLTEALIRSSLVLLAGLGAAWLLRNRSAAIRHCVLAGSIVAAAVAAPLGRAVPSMAIVSMPAITLPLSPAAERQSGPRVSTVEPEPTAAPPRDSSMAAVDWLVILWLSGAAFGLIPIVMQLLNLWRTSARSKPLLSGRWVEAVEDARRQYGVRRSIAVLQTDADDLLATWGWRRPRILLPPNAGEWDLERIRVVVLHELAHIRRHDWIVQLAASVVCRVYWFQPLMWLACRRLRRES